MIKVPFKYLIRDTDRHGNIRYYVARRGRRKIRIWEPYGTPEFFKAYQRALAALEAPAANVIQRVPEGSFEALCRTYLRSAQFQASLAHSTKQTKQRELRRLCKRIGPHPVKKIEPRHIQKWMDELSQTPAAANQLLKTLRSLFKFAINRGLLLKDPSLDIGKVKYKAESHHTWTREEVERFFARHPEGSQARLAVMMFLFTGLRVSDLASLGSDQFADDEIRLGTHKTGAELRLYVHPLLKFELMRHVISRPAILRTSFGKPFSIKGLANKMKQWCVEAGLPHCSSHGLRSAGATLAAENGATVNQLMAMYGWTNPAMAMKYTAAADKKRLSRQASEKIGIGFGWSPDEFTPTTHDEWDENSKSWSEISELTGKVALPAGIEPAFAT